MLYCTPSPSPLPETLLTSYGTISAWQTAVDVMRRTTGADVGWAPRSERPGERSATPRLRRTLIFAAVKIFYHFVI